MIKLTYTAPLSGTTSRYFDTMAEAKDFSETESLATDLKFETFRPKFNIPDNSGDRFEIGALVNERVSFVPAFSIECTPPYIKGMPDGCWAKYRKGERPRTKKGWQLILGMPIMTML